MPLSAVIGAALLAGGVLVGAARAADLPATPLAAEQRYQEAQRLTQARRYREAAQAYLEVAGDAAAPEPLRAQALFAAALMQQNARDYESAVRLYEEVQRRFPDSQFALRARGAAAAMTQGPRWLEFHRRRDEAWDELSPGKEIAERDGRRAARDHLERAASLLAALLHDFADQPQGREVAMALGDAHMLLARFDLACDDYGRAVALSRGPADAARGTAGVVNSALAEAEERLLEARLSLRRQRIVTAAMALLAAAALALLGLRPWRYVDARTVQLGGLLVIATLLLSLLAMAAAWAIVHFVDENSPVSATAAALLVALPGVTGVVFALGYRGALLGRCRDAGRAAGLAAVFAALAALCVATMVIQSFGLFPVLDSML